MEFLYFTIAGLILYSLSDFILNKIEHARGARFPNRSLIFLIIIMVMALGSFSIIDRLSEEPKTAPTTSVDSSASQDSVKSEKK